MQLKLSPTPPKNHLTDLFVYRHPHHHSHPLTDQILHLLPFSEINIYKCQMLGQFNARICRWLPLFVERMYVCLNYWYLVKLKPMKLLVGLKLKNPSEKSYLLGMHEVQYLCAQAIN